MLKARSHLKKTSNFLVNNNKINLNKKESRRENWEQLKTIQIHRIGPVLASKSNLMVY